MTDYKTSVRIRAAEPSDAAALSELVGSEGVFEGTSQTPLAPIASRIERYSKFDPNGLVLVAVNAQDSSQIAGMLGLYVANPSLRRAHVRYLAISVAREWQGRGVGDQLMREAMRWADDWTGILRIELQVLADNVRAIALYERHGFVREGVLKAHSLRAGSYVDALTMARLHPKPPSISNSSHS